ncbi:MAG TPA: relaxase MobL, partial [Candidatus Dormibacteraeota bacterium]
MTPTSILRVKVTPVSAKGGVRRAAGGFLRYVQHRDHHFPDEQVKDVEGFVRYVAYRDAAASERRLFDAQGTAGTAERRALTDHVARSTRGLAPSWRQGRDGVMRDQQLAVYRFVLSPADARGLDLRELTRATMAELGEKAGRAGSPPWIAAEHRNTDQPHVHIVMAARRTTQPGQYRAFRLTRDRLAAMKEAMWREVDRQRDERQQAMGQATRALERQPQVEPPATGLADHPFDPIAITERKPTVSQRPKPSRGSRTRDVAAMVRRVLRRLAASYRREA